MDDGPAGRDGKLTCFVRGKVAADILGRDPVVFYMENPRKLRTMLGSKAFTGHFTIMGRELQHFSMNGLQSSDSDSELEELEGFYNQGPGAEGGLGSDGSQDAGQGATGSQEADQNAAMHDSSSPAATIADATMQPATPAKTKTD